MKTINDHKFKSSLFQKIEFLLFNNGVLIGVIFLVTNPPRKKKKKKHDINQNSKNVEINENNVVAAALFILFY